MKVLKLEPMHEAKQAVREVLDGIPKDAGFVCVICRDKDGNYTLDRAGDYKYPEMIGALQMAINMLLERWKDG